MKDLSNQVIKEIKGKKLHPKSKSHFILKNVLFWCAFVLSIGIGMIAFSAFLFRVMSNDWGIYRHLGRGPLPHFFLTLPYLWIIVMALFALLAIYTFQHTKGWYRHKPIIIITASVVISVVGGTFMFMAGYGDKVDYSFSHPLPGVMSGQHQGAWSHPELGLLGGEIVALEDEKVFILQDFGEKEWTVIFIGMHLKKPLTVGDEIKAIGEMTGECEFEAVEIRPWRMHPYLDVPGLQGRALPRRVK